MRFLVLLVAALAAIGIAVPAEAAWPISKPKADACEADGPKDHDAAFTMVAFGPEVFLLFSSPSYAAEPGTYPVTLRFDDGREMTLNAEGHSGSYGVALVPALADALQSATRVTVTAGKETHAFPLAGAAEALNGVLKCVGLGGYKPGAPPRPIAEARNWMLFEALPGTDRCAVRRDGSEVDTELMQGEHDGLILVAGRNDWDHPGWTGAVSLKIDEAAPVTLQGAMLTNVVITDASAQKTQLLKAKTLAWHLPWGDFHAQVDGIDLAYKALASCQAHNAAPAKP